MLEKGIIIGKLKKVLREKSRNINGIYISSYVPRKCGIATYTKDLTNAINFINPCSEAEIIALIKPGDETDYGTAVKFKINQYEIDTYIKAAEYINRSKTDIVILEHEFGLYGGEFGKYIVKFIELLKKPLIVTTHTIPDDASKGYGLVLKDVIKYAQKVIVMMPESLQKLIKKYNYPKEKIEIIPHGVPDIALEPNGKYKKEKGLEGRLILGNINLLSENRGLEYTIEAINEIKRQFSNVLYLIIGQTHPVVLQTAGEKYRNFLKEKIKQSNLAENVKFINEYISLDELIEWLKVIDIYITPYLDPQQSASGALAYAIGAGKVCISTPYLYAKEVLAKERGIIVPFRNSQAIADAVINIYSNPIKKLAIEKKTYNYGRPMTWHNVALQHLNLFKEVIDKYTNVKSVNVSMDEVYGKYTYESFKYGGYIVEQTL
ncbi:MAG TPA: glycosyltransferase family 4 protein [Candidatus Humimicrobiaceae bacterium]